MPQTKTRFSAMQYYLAHARNTVHARLDVDRVVTEGEFHNLVAQVIKAAPHLLWEENLSDSTHVQGWSGDVSTLCHMVDAEAVDAVMAQPLNDTGVPAFRAICAVTGDGQSQIVFQTSHALMEGGDVSGLLRGRTSKIEERETAEPGLSTAAQIGIWTLIPLMFALHLLTARFEKKTRSDFGFARLSFDRADIRRVARDLGISQRDLTFALVSHHRGQIPNPKKKLFTAFTSLPAKRVRLCDDEFLEVRVDDCHIPTSRDPKVYAHALAATLGKQNRHGLFVQTWHRRLNQVHRWLHPRAPWIYPRALFGYAPYDVVMSMLPPIVAGRAFTMLSGARVFAGSDTGTAESCIFAVSDTEVTVTLWSGPHRAAHVNGIAATATAFGVRSTIEGKVGGA